MYTRPRWWARETTPVRQKGYRPDIDGLRALAVLSVVLFHAGFPALAEGFLGVDSSS
jgi:peptidoglycan/LPS O-acetylase OafA/YrhL